MTLFYITINWLLIFSYWILIIVITLKVLIKRRAVHASMAWLLMIYIIPILGIIIYLLFGERNIGKRRVKRSQGIINFSKKWIKDFKHYKLICATEISDVAKSLFTLCEHRQGIRGIKGNKIKLISDSHDVMHNLINDIKLAKYTIDIVFYIWQIGGLTNSVAEALMSAAQRGVRCRLMLDSAGSIQFFRSMYPILMKKSGINIVEALNVSIFKIFLRRMDVRQHRKMILIDNYISYVGSMNMVDPSFFKQDIGIGQWIDMMIRIEGPITYAMGIIFSCDWAIETGEYIMPYNNINVTLLKKNNYHNNNNIQIIASGPGAPKGIIHQALLTSLYAARKKLIITTPYLVPSDDLLYAICTAAHRGVEVHIIIPKNNDSMLVYWASRVFFTELLDAGVIIHQFKGGLLHTKSVLIDEQLSLIGTVNLDMRSLWLNFEITLVIDDNTFASNLADIHTKYIAQSCLIHADHWSQRPYWQRIIEKFFYLLSPLL